MGILTDIKENVGKYHSKMYIILNDSLDTCVWGKVQVRYMMNKVQLGDKVIITYTGKEKRNEIII